jgi:DNA helicase-2/ATP-dependent DNA helicase PcrA
MSQKSMIAYKDVLNQPQYEAVSFNDGPLLVIAGAGSGKTRTLTYRVARMVQDGIAPASILLLTFTRRASQEMLKRASNLLDNRCEGVSGGTFHSFANAILRKYASFIGLDNAFTIIDRVDMEHLISILKKESGAGLKDRSFPKNRTLASIFSASVNKVLAVDDIIYEDHPHLSQHMDAMVTLHNDYQQYKSDHSLLDYDDLLIYLHRLLNSDADIRDRLASTYKYLMVDEYQDTNQVQAEILYLLTQQHQNIMVVGDDSQSIYAFRGAAVENILSFPNRYPDTTIIRLEENYRSIQPVLTLTNTIIDRASNKYTKTLFSSLEGDELPVLVRAGSENSQSRFVIDKIKDLSLQGVRLSEIAVLFRAGFHSFDLEIELSREAFPFIKVGGFKFMDSAHIKDVLAFLRVVYNAEDTISWYRILLLLDRIGPKSAKNIFNAIQEQQNGVKGLQTAALNERISKQVAGLADLLVTMDPDQMSVSAMGEAVLAYYLPVLKKKYDDHPKRARDLEQLLAIMERYQSLESFLTDMAIEPPTTAVDETFSMTIPEDQRLTLSTIHSAKGLEWHTVFIIWALDGRFPSARAINKEEELEEELRLMYVAATRAKENLLITYPGQLFDRISGSFLNRPSRFLDQIPLDVLARETVY